MEFGEVVSAAIGCYFALSVFHNRNPRTAPPSTKEKEPNA